MCAGSPAGFLQPETKFSTNYGYGAVGKAPAMAKEERQWYKDQGFGDPNTVVGKRQGAGGGRYGIPSSAGYYQGVSPEARYLYTQSSIPKTVYLEQRAPSAASSLGVPANTRYAGKSLTINPMAA
jgi:hypothetical protein